MSATTTARDGYVDRGQIYKVEVVMRMETIWKHSYVTYSTLTVVTNRAGGTSDSIAAASHVVLRDNVN
jgi:hypothetical protein